MWEKPNVMPEFCPDRTTRSHEYVFLLAKSSRYYWDRRAAQEPVTGGAHSRGHGANPKSAADRRDGIKANLTWKRNVSGLVDQRNMRSVWRIPTAARGYEHFATFPDALAERCIRLTSRPGDLVLDPYMGSGTTARVAQRLGRRWVGCELVRRHVDYTHRSLGIKEERHG